MERTNSGTVEAVGVGEVVTLLGHQWTVVESCDTKDIGRWVCVTRDTGAFRNNWDKDKHINLKGAHRLAWLCLAHDAIEKP